MNTLIARALVLLYLSAAGLCAQDCWQERFNESAPAARWEHTAV